MNSGMFVLAALKLQDAITVLWRGFGKTGSQRFDDQTNQEAPDNGKKGNKDE